MATIETVDGKLNSLIEANLQTLEQIRELTESSRQQRQSIDRLVEASEQQRQSIEHLAGVVMSMSRTVESLSGTVTRLVDAAQRSAQASETAAVVAQNNQNAIRDLIDELRKERE